jgi:hypothetical protein
VKAEVSDAGAARSLLAMKINQEKENVPMWKNLFKSNARLAYGAVVALLLVGVVLLFPGVRAAAGSFLGLFRIEQIAIVEVNPANLPNQFGRSATMEEVVSQNVNFEEFDEPKKVSSVAEAEAESGLEVRLPVDAGEHQDLLVQYGAEVSFDIEVAQIEFLLNEIERPDISFPEEIDGATVTLTVPASVVAGYGDCETYEEAVVEKGEDTRIGRQSDCMIFLQMPSPTIDAPADLNLPEIGSAFLQLMGMSEADAVQFSETVDWTTTLVVPIPQRQVDYEYLKIDGVQGTLITETQNQFNPGYMLLWVKDGMIYSISGQGNWKEALVFAASLP